MKEYVIDTSVVVKWFTEDEEDTKNAIQLRHQLYNGFCALIVPDLLIYELANALKYNSNFTDKDVKTALDSIFNMGLDIRKADVLITKNAIDIAFKFNVTVYDSYFLALSQTIKKPFITADYKFFEKVKSFKHIIKLSEVQN